MKDEKFKLEATIYKNVRVMKNDVMLSPEMEDIWEHEWNDLDKLRDLFVEERHKKRTAWTAYHKMKRYQNWSFLWWWDKIWE